MIGACWAILGKRRRRDAEHARHLAETCSSAQGSTKKSKDDVPQ